MRSLELALEIAGLEQTEVKPVTDESLHRPARRPANSCLRCLASEPLGLAPMLNWQDGLAKFLAGEPVGRSCRQCRYGPNLSEKRPRSLPDGRRLLLFNVPRTVLN